MTRERNRVIDLVRAACLIIVVGLHSFMAGISNDGGRLRVFDATAGQPWFAALTWLVQIMPLFFLVGGFAGLTHWRAMRARGSTAIDFVHDRLQRLARPAVITFGTIAAGFGLASLLGVPTALLDQVGFRMGQPMWFLAVYLGVSTLVPLLARLHETAPRRTLTGLVAGAVAIDAIRFSTGIEAVGYLNLAFVWLAMQQLGFGYADGWFRRPDRRQLWLALSLALGMLIMLVGIGGYSPDLIVNLNPPTISLLLLGLVQASALALATPSLERFAGRPQIRSAAAAINGRAMTIYLWHMPVLVLVAVGALTAGLAFPTPLGPDWWDTRLLWLGAVGLAVAIAAGQLSRFERGIDITSRTPARTGAVITAVLLAISAVVVVLIGGFNPLSATLAATGLAVALRFGSTPPSAAGAYQPGFVRGHDQLRAVA